MRRALASMPILLAVLACSMPTPHEPALPRLALREGHWRAWLVAQEHELPFGLDLCFIDAWSATVLNGDESLEVPGVVLDGDTLTLAFPHYDSVIVATVSQHGARLDGTWRKRRAAEEWVELPFHADAGPGPRFAGTAEGDPWPGTEEAVAGRWSVQFASDEAPAVGEFRIAFAGEARGTFLTTTGDYRYLAGRIDREWPGMASLAPAMDDGVLRFGLRLSCFDGAHAFLFTALTRPDGSLTGDFWSGDRFHDTWTAVRDEQATLPDGFGLTRASGAVTLDDLVFPDLDGVPRRLSDPAFAGKARILQVFGSWCPNCADEADELVRLQQEYGPRGLSIVGLAFELIGDPARDAEQVRRHAARHGITWPLLVAGVSDRAKATASLGLLDRLRAYPTTIFLDADGGVRAVHTGYNGPATGDAYVRQRADFEKLIEELLAE